MVGIERAAPCAWRISGVSFFIFGFEGEQIQKRTRDALSCPFLFSNHQSN